MFCLNYYLNKTNYLKKIADHVASSFVAYSGDVTAAAVKVVIKKTPHILQCDLADKERRPRTARSLSNVTAAYSQPWFKYGLEI